MPLQLPIPLTPEMSSSWKFKLEQADQANQKIGTDVIVGVKSPRDMRQSRLILVDSSGGQWSLTVDPTGALHTTKIQL